MTETDSDYARLLEPIASAAPAGQWVRDEPLYRQLVQARRMEDPTLPQGVWKHDVKRADWGAVSRLAAEILATRSKDLQVAAWLLEAEVRRRGFAALGPGLSFIAALCRAFWPDLHPALEKGDPDARNAPFHWLNEKLPVGLHQLPVTRSGNAGEVAYTWTDFANARRHESVRHNDTRAAARAEQGGRITLEAFNDSAAATPEPVLRRLRDAFRDADRALADLAGALDELEGPDAPSLSALADTIEDIANWADSLLPPAPPEQEIDMPADPADVAEPHENTPQPPPASPGGPITSREEAYRRLNEAADYLFRTERHSPVPYIIRQAIAWGDMPLHELVAELSRNGSDLSQLLGLLGLRKQS